MVEVMKIMETSFKRSHACIATLSAPNPAAGHHWTTPLMETPGHSLYLHKVHFKFWIWRLCFWKKKSSSFSLLILVIFHSGILIRQMFSFVHSPLNNYFFIVSITYLFYIPVIQQIEDFSANDHCLSLALHEEYSSLLLTWACIAGLVPWSSVFRMRQGLPWRWDICEAGLDPVCSLETSWVPLTSAKLHPTHKCRIRNTCRLLCITRIGGILKGREIGQIQNLVFKVLL